MASLNNYVETSTVALSEFTLFSKLPQELRDEIWEFALPAPRVLKVFKASPLLVGHQGFTSRYGIDTYKLPTQLLHVSREARQVALQRYQLSFTGLIYGGPIYFDYERDCLLFMQYSALQWFRADHDFCHFHAPPPAAVREWQDRIHNVGVMGEFFESLDQTFLLQCPLLKKLIVQTPFLNRGCEQHGIASEMTYIIERLVNAWRQRLQTDDAKKLPYLYLTANVERNL